MICITVKGGRGVIPSHVNQENHLKFMIKDCVMIMIKIYIRNKNIC